MGTGNIDYPEDERDTFAVTLPRRHDREQELQALDGRHASKDVRLGQSVGPSGRRRLQLADDQTGPTDLPTVWGSTEVFRPIYM